MRLTQNYARVAHALLSDPGGRHYGYGLITTSGVRGSALYPMLAKFLEQGWVEDGWENPEEAAGRPPRRYYQLTDLGRQHLAAATAAAEQPSRHRAWRLAT